MFGRARASCCRRYKQGSDLRLGVFLGCGKGLALQDSLSAAWNMLSIAVNALYTLRN